jgi:hypothetical protein
MGEFVSYPKFVSPATKTLHPDTHGVKLTLDELILALLKLGTNPAASGLIRMANNELIKARNAGNNADITLLGTDSSDHLLLGSGLTGILKAVSSVVSASGIVNADVDAAAAIDMTKLQPSEFLAYASTQSNVTGDATVYTVVFANEIIDGNGRFNSASTFVASGSGLYLFEIVLFIEGVTAAMTDADVKLATSNRIYNFNFNPNALKTPSNRFTFATSIHADMDDNDTAFVQISITGGTKVANIDGGDVRSHFAGHFIG